MKKKRSRARSASRPKPVRAGARKKASRATSPAAGRGRADTRILEALHRISDAIRSRSDLDTVLQTIAREATGCFPGDVCSIMLLDDSHRDLIFSAQHGLPDWDAQHIRFKLGEGIAGWVAKHAKPAVVPDVAEDRRFMAIPGQKGAIRSMCCVPLLSAGRVIGVLTLTHSTKVGAFGESDLAQANLLATHISMNIENHRLYELSVSDGLTQTYNRRYFDKRFAEELSYARRFRESVSLCMIDIDLFKSLNDAHGHLTGDLVLSRLAATLKGNLRDYDILARYGGEEFALIAPNTPKRGAAVVADRLRQLVERLTVPQGNLDLHVTVSVGVAAFPDDGIDPETVIAVADQALYSAKEAGRNRVVVAGGSGGAHTLG